MLAHNLLQHSIIFLPNCKHVMLTKGKQLPQITYLFIVFWIMKTIFYKIHNSLKKHICIFSRSGSKTVQIHKLKTITILEQELGWQFWVWRWSLFFCPWGWQHTVYSLPALWRQPGLSRGFVDKYPKTGYKQKKEEKRQTDKHTGVFIELLQQLKIYDSRRN